MPRSPFVAFAPDGKTLAVATSGASVELWDFQTGKEVRRFAGCQGGLVQFSPEGKMLAAAGLDGAVHLWETATGKRLAVAEGPKSALSSLAFAPDGRVLACGIDGQALALSEITRDQVLSPVTGHQHPVTALAFAKDGREIITAGTDCTVCWWDPDGRQHLRHMLVTDFDRLRGRRVRGTGRLALSSDGKYVAGPGELGGSGMRLWETAKGKALCDLEHVSAGRGHTVAVFSPDSTRFAFEGTDSTIHLWDVATGQELLALKCSEQGLAVNVMGQGALSFSPDSKRLARPCAGPKVVPRQCRRHWLFPATAS